MEIKKLTSEELMFCEWREFIRQELTRLSGWQWEVAFQTNYDSIVFACYWQKGDDRYCITMPQLSISRLSAGNHEPELAKYAFMVVQQRIQFYGE